LCGPSMAPGTGYLFSWHADETLTVQIAVVGDRVTNIYEAANGTSPHAPTSTPASNFVVDPGIATETDTTKKKIQAAIDAAPTITADPTRYTIIEIRPGTYAEDLKTYDRRVFLMAKRVMDCGDSGHILLSKHAAEDLEEYEQWRPLLHDLGACEMKHGMRVSTCCSFRARGLIEKE
jgi:pectin methylesterase-like acyl-CoA thioesterase